MKHLISQATGDALAADADVLSRLVNRLRLKHLKFLAALGETLVLNQAARLVNTSQPAATKMLADLETAFGFALFERHPRGVRPTPLGQHVVGYARSIQNTTQAFAADIENRRLGGHGQLVIGAIMGAAPDVLVRAVADLKQRRPLLDLKIMGETSNEVSLLLARGEVELAIGRLGGPQDEHQFNFTPLANETIVLVVRKGHPLLRQRKLDWPVLLAWPWVLQAPSSAARQLLESALAGAGVGSPTNSVECTSVFGLLQLILKTDSVAALSETIVRDHIKAGLFKVLPLAIDQQLASFGIMSRKGEALSQAAQDFARCLERAAAASLTPASP